MIECSMFVRALIICVGAFGSPYFTCPSVQPPGLSPFPATADPDRVERFLFSGFRVALLTSVHMLSRTTILYQDRTALSSQLSLFAFREAFCHFFTCRGGNVHACNPWAGCIIYCY